MEIHFASKRKESATTTASLDRIDSDKGYAEDNVQWVHKKINSMKQTMRDELFIEMCKRVAAHNSS
jgi:hypothetical protein